MTPYSAILAVLIARLTFHSQPLPGRILRAVKFEPVPTKEIDGVIDFPSIRIFPPDLTETFVHRAPLAATVQIRIQLATARTDGFEALLEFVEQVLDAIETKEDGTIETTLDHTLRMPLSLKTAGSFTKDLNFAMDLSLQLAPAVTALRGQRRQLTYFIDAANRPLMNADGLIRGPA